MVKRKAVELDEMNLSKNYRLIEEKYTHIRCIRK